MVIILCPSCKYSDTILSLISAGPQISATSNKRRTFRYPHWKKRFPLISTSNLVSASSLNAAVLIIVRKCIHIVDTYVPFLFWKKWQDFDINSSNIIEVIRAILNLFIYLFIFIRRFHTHKKYKKHKKPKNYKKHKKHKKCKKHKKRKKRKKM